MKNFKLFFMLAFTILIAGLSYSSAITKDIGTVSEVVDVDVGIEIVAVDILHVTDYVSTTKGKENSFMLNSKFTLLEFHNQIEIWKFENIPLKNNTNNSFQLNRNLLSTTSGGLSDYCSS